MSLPSTQTVSRYKSSRTLVRSLCRLPGEENASPGEYKRKLARLRAHFERFNVDAAELCQWLMGLRLSERSPGSGIPELWAFMLEPRIEGLDADEKQRDAWRLAVFDDLAGIKPVPLLASQPLARELRVAMTQAAARLTMPTNVCLARLLSRLRTYDPAHRLVLLKSAAEWIVARYQRAVENCTRQREEWAKEKAAWEAKHPELTAKVRQRFTDVFKSLVWDESKPPGVRNKRPRICPHERLKQDEDNCAYNNKEGHALVCWAYSEFLTTALQRLDAKYLAKYFQRDAEKYLALPGLSRTERMWRLIASFKDEMLAAPASSGKKSADKGRKPPTEDVARKLALEKQQRFAAAWVEYVKALTPHGFDEQALYAKGCLPHCTIVDGGGGGINTEGKIAGMRQKSKCQHNPHTTLCDQYKRLLAALPPEILALEPQYREWRKDFLAPPRMPSFEYPSSRKLPMPKIFGQEFHEIDLPNSRLRLRLDDMPRGQWIEFGFKPWPRGYRPSRSEVQITSVHVNFVGSRPRAGLRFDAPRRPCRFTCEQDQIDTLRSRDFPRRGQDQQFLNAARELLLNSFTGRADFADLRILAVDVGEKGASAAVFHGTAWHADVPLEIIKINKLYSGMPAGKLEKPASDKRLSGPLEFNEEQDHRGLRKEHVKLHLEKLQAGAARIAEHRQARGAKSTTLLPHDHRGLTRHAAGMIRDWVRLNAARIVAAAEAHDCDLIVFETQRDQKVPGYNELDVEARRQKLSMAVMSYGRIRRKVIEKAVERGMRVVTVPDYKTSMMCSACGHNQCDEKEKWKYKIWKENKGEKKFECQCAAPPPKGAKAAPGPRCPCKAQLHSDTNAARVLARVFWGQARGGIDLPIPPE